MEDEGYFSKVCLYRLILSLIPHLQSQECPPFSGPARALFLQDIYTLFLDRKGEVIESLLHLLFLNYFQLKIINLPKWDVCGWHILYLE